MNLILSSEEFKNVFGNEDIEEIEKNRNKMLFSMVISKEQIELLQLDNSGIRIAEYLVDLPSKEVLQKKLRKVIEIERKNRV
jgi:hypothetical protein